MTSPYLWMLAAAVAGIIIALWRAFSAGKSSGVSQEQNKQAAGRIEAIGKAKEVDDEISNLDDADIDARLEQWMRDGRKR